VTQVFNHLNLRKTDRSTLTVPAVFLKTGYAFGCAASAAARFPVTTRIMRLFVTFRIVLIIFGRRVDDDQERDRDLSGEPEAPQHYRQRVYGRTPGISGRPALWPIR
jgi:hypothetical protein